VATYFDSTDADDKALLHASIRAHAELANVAALVEEEVLRHYTLGDTASGREVYLQGYTADADAADAALRESLRRTVGEVTSHRLRHYDKEPGLVRESRGGRSKQWSAKGVDPNWPDGWTRRLVDFDTRTPFYNL